MWKKGLISGCVLVLVAGIGLFLLLQLLPVGKDHNNPAVVREPAWDSPETRALAKRACFDCHSNETTWPWYSQVAPVSWLVYRDVVEGREKLNFSDWGGQRGRDERDELGEVVREGEMPLPIYLITHPEARLSDAEKQQLIRGLEALPRASQSSTR